MSKKIETPNLKIIMTKILAMIKIILVILEIMILKSFRPSKKFEFQPSARR